MIYNENFVDHKIYWNIKPVCRYIYLIKGILTATLNILDEIVSCETEHNSKVVTILIIISDSPCKAVMQLNNSLLDYLLKSLLNLNKKFSALILELWKEVLLICGSRNLNTTKLYFIIWCSVVRSAKKSFWHEDA